MKTQLNKSTLNIAVKAALLFTISTSVVAEDLETITVTANRVDQNINQSLSSQHVITRVDIEQIQPATTIELLRTVAGFDFSLQGGVGQQSSVFVRGANANHTLVLLDGIRIGSATLGTTELQSISPAQIERIEIVKGPRAAIWGSDAIGGVIQIFTRKMEGGEYQIDGTVGSERYRQLQAAVGISHGEGSTSISVTKQRAEGFDVLIPAEDDNDGYDYLSVALKGEQKITNQFKLDWLIQANENETEYDNAWAGNNEAETDNYAWYLRSFYNQQFDTFTNQTSVTVSQSRDSNLNKPVAVTLFETKRKQVSLINHSDFESGLGVTAGVDYSKENIQSTTNFADKERSILGVFTQAGMSSGAYNGEVAVRYDDVEGVDSEVSFSLAGGYKFNDTTRASLSYGTGFKTPTFNDLYFPESAFSSGNPDLIAETSKTMEFILTHQQGEVTAAISLYQSEVENLIEWQPNENFFYKPVNFALVDIKGAEFNLQWDSSFAIHKLNYSYNDSTDDSTGLQLIRRSKQHFNYSINKQLGEASLYLEYSYKGEAYDSDFVLGRVTIPSYEIVNAAVDFPLSENLTLKAKVSNGFDKEYLTSHNYNTQGQVWYLGFSYKN